MNDNTVRRVIEDANIMDVVGKFCKLRKVGNTNYTCHCPFHDDRHDGNFIVRPKGVAKYPNSWHCFVCDEGGDAVSFLMKKENLSFQDAVRWLAQEQHVDIDDKTVNIDIKPYTPPPPLPLMELPRSLVCDTMKRQSPFVGWLNALPWDSMQRERLGRVLWEYCVGGWEDGRVVFWQIDKAGVPRAAKLMEYLPDGHRNKLRHPGWIYNQPQLRDEFDPEGHTVKKTLFGEHLLRRYPSADVHIVESEKTALFCAVYFGNPERDLWLATAGKGNLRRELLEPLIEDRRVIALHPDKDGIDEWREGCKELDYRHAYVNNAVLALQWKEVDGEKADIADVLIRVMGESRAHRVQKISDVMPAIGLMK